MKLSVLLQPSNSRSSSSTASCESKRGIILAASISLLGAAATFAIYQLTKILFSVVRDSEYEAGKLITAVSATIQSDSPDVEVPEELELYDDLEEIYTYGSLQELFYRRSMGGDTDWEWSFDSDEWYSTADLSPNHAIILDPPSLIFIARLQLQSVARRKFAAAAAAGQNSSSSSSSSAGRSLKQPSRIPPPLELPEWAKQQQAHVAAGVASSAGGAKQQSKSSSSGVSSSGSDGSSAAAAAGASGGTLRGVSSPDSSAGAAGRRLEDAPDMLCCPITGHIMLQPVTLPSGKTFEYEAVRRWVTQHGTDPTTLTPLSILDVHPNLLIREMVERWLAGSDPLAETDAAD